MIDLSKEVQIFFISMAPIGELRVSLPLVLVVYKFNWIYAYLISVLGNLTAVIIILLFLGKIFDFISNKYTLLKKNLDLLFEKTKNNKALLEKWGSVALMFFVAIPLPFTGGWTASIISLLFGIPFKKALFFISLGIILSGFIVLSAVFIGISIEKYFGLQALSGILFLALLVFYLLKIKINKRFIRN